MEKRESIIRKLNALKAKANDPSIKDTPEAINAMAKFAELMERYNLDLTDLEVKTSGIKFGSKYSAKGKETKTERHPIAFVILSIEKMANVEAVCRGFNSYEFMGTPADIEYAEFLYKLIYNSCERAAIAYKMTANYQRDINLSKLKGDKVMWNFKYGFVMACYHAMEAIINSAKTTGTDLIVLKNDLITSFRKEQGMGERPANKQITLKNTLAEQIKSGYQEGAKVKLRQELN